ncbi:amino acid racemase [Antarcticibacterium sp. 1MA-6-2]|uniref:aspartate/glutamate racemase family protein n=1 Tax=Antarcticibacterium sp. 1MA-6-2 TaxID=2908210 RepID=UPI001F408826|nr:amino acid racemase [Antarcticibacterium sp. 1MA-6-2]UJH90954.1 amino acid racemase [Antarcticibacterium sp. 1MA-6-2]
MKKIGLIGGTSWHSTIVYYRLINEMVGDKMGKQANPELLIYSLNVELMREHNVEKINNKYLEIAKTLQTAGAKAILICANTPHLVYDFVQPKINIPILHIADAIGGEARKKGLSNLGLLGTRPTMTGDFISSPLKKRYDIETIIPDSEYIDGNHDFISNELTKGIFTEEAKKFYLEQMRLLRTKGAEGIILGCTELPMLVDQKDFDLPLLATTNLHAQMAANFILEEN